MTAPSPSYDSPHLRRPGLIRPHRRAAALLLTVGVLALAVVSLSITARRSMADALAARAAAEDLQRDLIVASIEQSILPYAAEIIEFSRSEKPGPPIVDWAAELAGISVRCRIADEQAKLNLNRHAEEHARWVVEQAVRSLVTATSADMTVRLRPHRPQAGSALPIYGSFDQVFKDASAQELLPDDSDETTPLDRLTLWGDGRVNVMMADPNVLIFACRGLLSEVDVRRIVRIRSEGSDEEDLNALLQRAGVGTGSTADEKTSPFAEHLTVESTCHSVWITLASPQRRRDVLLVREAPTALNEDPDATTDTKLNVAPPKLVRLEWE